MGDLEVQMYDGIDYRYKSADADRLRAVEIITNVIGSKPIIDGLEYSLNLFAGGTGVECGRAGQA